MPIKIPINFSWNFTGNFNTKEVNGLKKAKTILKKTYGDGT